MEQSFNTQTTMSDFNSNATTKSQEHLSSAPAQELDVSAQPVVEVEESATTIETKSDRTISATQSSGSASDLMSLFKSIDNNTLHALASTIQLALNSSTSQHVHVPVDNSKVPSPSPTTTVDKTADSQPTTPAETVKKKETSAMASNVVFTSPKTTAQEQPNDGEPPAIVPTGSSSTDFQTIDEAVNADQGVLPQTKAPPLPVTEVEANSKSLGVGAPRLVIATVLATRVGTSSVSDAAETNQTKADGALTVCIPISKEVKFQVKNPKVEKEVEEKGADVTCDSSREKQNKSSTGQDETKDETSEVPTVKSPHLSLLSAQELMFDPKYMYKEYNLRRVRRPESSPEQSSPQKKQKLEELLTAKESPGDTGTDRVESVINKEGTEEDTREKSQKRKRGRPLLASSGEPPTEPKKRRDDSAPAEAVVTAVVSSDSSVAEEIKSKSDVNKCHTIRRSKLSLSIPHIRHVSSSPPPVTLTQLLSVPKAAEKVPTIAKEVKEDATLEHLTRDKVDKKAVKHTPKLPPRVGSLHETRSQLLCSLCKQKGGVLNLGFLFGPYRYQPEVECNDDTVTNANTTSSSGGVEVWLHEDCCVWAPGVCLVGRQLQGLREALTDASKMVCTVCKKHGATLWCATRSCKSIYHFPCAVEKGCILNEEQFQTLCPKHKETTHVQD